MATQLLKLAHKYRPETKKEKKQRWLAQAEKKAAGKGDTPIKRPRSSMRDHGKDPCEEKLVIKRQSNYTISVGTSFELKCPMQYCTLPPPNVTWCKFEEKQCLPVRDSLNQSVQLDKNATSASRPGTLSEERIDRWLLYGLLPLGALPLLFTACFCLFRCLRKHQEKQKKSLDSTRREVNLAAVPQNFGSEQIEVGTRQNSRTLPSDSGIYDSDPWFRTQEEPGVSCKPSVEARNKNVVYASLNHSVTNTNPRQTREVKETPTEYAVICVRS
ncbi:PREDICTED: b- and T-lymphocyte attenuator [Elephantulus edwardii]|uniref:b- and T-lymphocyte attenuator n=1 Tax=Elephantulus edwardii TaxID=28737 RepID=UPI0003F06869|nr:PREDICTED: b- and T-lymphocyte attenuator [Elephantulus edwardii]